MKNLAAIDNNLDITTKEYVDAAIPTVPTNVSVFTNDAGYVTTDEKLKTSALANSTTAYYPVLTTNASTAETKKYSTLLQVGYKDSNYDVFNLRIGNGVGTKGQLRLSNSGSSGDFTTLVPNATKDTTITLPSASGTLALISNIPTVPTISLNGSTTTSPSFYAPTSAGTSGYYLKSNGSGAPTWAAISAGTDEKLKTSVTTTTGTYYYPILTGTSSSAETKKYAEGLNFVMDNNSNWLTIGTSSKGGKLSLLKTHEAIIVLNGSMTTNTTITLPATTGTLALTSDIPTVPTNISVFTNDAGYVTTDEKLAVIEQTADAQLYPVLTTNSTDASTKVRLATGRFYVEALSNATTLKVGNYNYPGEIYLPSSQNLTVIKSSVGTSTRTITLPDATGTVALTSDIPSVPVTDVTLNGSSIVSGGIAAITNANGDVTFNGTVQGNLFYMDLATSDSLYTAINTAGWTSSVIV